MHVAHLRKVIVDGEYWKTFMKVNGFFETTLHLKKSSNLSRLPKRLQKANRIAAYEVPYLRDALVF